MLVTAPSAGLKEHGEFVFQVVGLDSDGRSMRGPERCFGANRSDLGGEFFDVFEQFLLAGQACEVEADHLIRSECRLSARPQCDQQTGDDGQVSLNFDSARAMT